MYGLKYGSLPLVHRVGGLADTVVDCHAGRHGRAAQATGFCFDAFDAAGYARALRRAFALHRRPGRLARACAPARCAGPPTGAPPRRATSTSMPRRWPDAAHNPHPCTMTLEDFKYDHPDRDVAAFKRAVANKLIYAVGKDPVTASPDDWLHATAFAVRDQLVERWMATTRAQYAQKLKRVYYLSMEFLIGRTFTNALLALELQDTVKQALADFGVDIQALAEREPDAALGNGGLGRLAACFLDSMATLGVPGLGYGIRYEYGMFRQRIVDGQQVETPDYWLTRGNPWEFQRPEVTYRVRFGGHVQRREGKGAPYGAAKWVDTHDVLAMAYDTIIPGYGTQATNTLRLWSARATEEIDLSAFNRGNYMEAVESKNHSENVSRVLYPDDSTPSGRELRLHQEYFFVSASVQDLLHRYLRNHTDFDELPDQVSIHLNDTHPVLAVPELMRLLIDEHGLPWDTAWAHTQKVFSYTNHTLMHEALETWPVEMFGRVLPRHLQILFDMNSRFLAAVTHAHGHDVELMRRLSLIDEIGERRVRMAYVAVLASHSINGVSGLHSELMKQSIFADFAKLFPERFNNKTNGVTPRRWLAQANPPLAALLDARIGRGWRRDLTQLAGAAADGAAAGLRARLPPCQAREQAAAGQLDRRAPGRRASTPTRCSTCRSSACTSTSGSCSTCCT